jgi:methionyl-tRNA formyltransferase
MSKKLNFAFFGGEPMAIPALEILYKNGLVPSLIISNPDKPKGRNLAITPPPTALWAKEHNIPLLQSEKIKGEEIKGNFDFFVVVSYGKIIPKEVLNLAKFGTINIHPSLLPRYRGPSPIVSAILNGDRETGVTIIKIDEEMDHGPILAQVSVNLSGDEFIEDLEKTLAEVGGNLLLKTIQAPSSYGDSPFAGGEEQDHSRATYCKKITKEDAEIKLDDDPITNWRKFRAYHSGPRIFFFKDGKRIIVTDAKLEDGKFVIKKIIPENGKEIPYNPL